jgi:hypothetical protein
MRIAAFVVPRGVADQAFAHSTGQTSSFGAVHETGIIWNSGSLQSDTYSGFRIFCSFVWFLLIVWVACRFMSVFFFSHLFGPLLGMWPLEKLVCFT